MGALVNNLTLLKALNIDGPIVVAEFGEIFGIPIRITESITVQWVMMIGLIVLFIILGRNLKVKPEGGRQAFAEMVVTMFNGIVSGTMGVKYNRHSPYISALLMFSVVLSLSTLFGFKPPTANISVIGAWGIITFFLVQWNRFKSGGLFKGMKSFAEPVIIVLPVNLLGEIMGPVSQSLRHYGNIMGGMIVGSIIYWALGNVAIFIPAVASLYFDIFSAVVQAFVFCTLTMVYIISAECE